MKKRPVLSLLMMVVITLPLSAQSLSPKEALKMLRKPSKRCPLPSLMKDDRTCMDFIYEMGKLETARLAAIADSVEARQSQNQLIKKALKNEETAKEKFAYALEQIDREEIRYNFFQDQKRELEEDRKALQRPAPTAQLVNVEYSHTGMAYNPIMPMKISLSKEGKVVGRCGRSEKDQEIDQQALNQINELVLKEKLYKLLPRYASIKSTLPDIPEIMMLDGMHWMLELEYSDGTSIRSGGEYTPSQNTNALEKMMTDYLRDLMPKMRE